MSRPEPQSPIELRVAVRARTLACVSWGSSPETKVMGIKFRTKTTNLHRFSRAEDNPQPLHNYQQSNQLPNHRNPHQYNCNSLKLLYSKRLVMRIIKFSLGSRFKFSNLDKIKSV